MFNFNLCNVVNVIILKTSHCYRLNNRFKNVIINHKVKSIIIIIDIAINEKDTYLYNRIIFLYLFQFCFNLIFYSFIITFIFIRINITSLLYSLMYKQLI